MARNNRLEDFILPKNWEKLNKLLEEMQEEELPEKEPLLREIYSQEGEDNYAS